MPETPPDALADDAPPAPPEPPPEPADEAPATFDLTIDEWCMRQSATDNRVELLSAFHAVEVWAGRTKASADAYAENYAAFAGRPA